MEKTRAEPAVGTRQRQLTKTHHHRFTRTRLLVPFDESVCLTPCDYQSLGKEAIDKTQRQSNSLLKTALGECSIKRNAMVSEHGAPKRLQKTLR